MAQEKPSLAKTIKTFAIGGMSGMIATCFIQPIDMVKVRIQLLSGANPGKSFGPAQVASTMLKETGFASFYKGIDSALMRQAVYTTARFGIFFNLSDYVKYSQGGQNLSIWQKAGCSLTAGGLGAFIGTPADLILIRMQTEGTLPKEQRRGYTSVFNAASRIPKEEGLTSLWKGGVPTIVRAMSLNLGMFTTYEQAKEMIAPYFPGQPTKVNVMSSFLAGAVGATMSLPFDNAKTKLQAQKPNPDGTLPYKNIVHAMAVTAKQSGVTGMWVGLPTYIFRIAPHVIITLLVSERIRAAIM